MYRGNNKDLWERVSTGCHPCLARRSRLTLLALAMFVPVMGFFFFQGMAADVSLFVVNKHGSPVEGLHKEDFRFVPENNGILFEHNPDIPLAVGIVFENSSFRTGVQTSNMEGLVKGILSALQPEDDVFLDSFGYAHVRFFGPGTSRELASETVSRFIPKDFLSRNGFAETYNDRVVKDGNGVRTTPISEVEAVLSVVRTLRDMPQPRKALVWVRDDMNLSHAVNLKNILPPDMCVFAVCFEPKEEAAVPARRDSAFFQNGVLQLVSADGSSPSILGQQIVVFTRFSYRFRWDGSRKAPVPKIFIDLPGMSIIGPPGQRPNVSLP